MKRMCLRVRVREEEVTALVNAAVIGGEGNNLSNEAVVVEF